MQCCQGGITAFNTFLCLRGMIYGFERAPNSRPLTLTPLVILAFTNFIFNISAKLFHKNLAISYIYHSHHLTFTFLICCKGTSKLYNPCLKRLLNFLHTLTNLAWMDFRLQQIILCFSWLPGWTSDSSNFNPWVLSFKILTLNSFSF